MTSPEVIEIHTAAQSAAALFNHIKVPRLRMMSNQRAGTLFRL